MTDDSERAIRGVRSRRMLMMRLLVRAIATCAAVPIVVGTVGRSIGGWDETVGFVAGLLVASLGIVWVLSARR